MDYREIEGKWQKMWAEKRIFEPKVDKNRKKFFFTTPYPYISGSLHIGHGRAVTESDIYCRYMRMKGYNVLYPLAFHITGTPVLGISSAIEKGDKKKIELFGGYVRNYVKDKKEVAKIIESFKDPWNIVNFFTPKMMDEYSSLGLGIDWTRRFTTGDPDYQKMVTWQFLKYKEMGFLTKGSYPVLYCPTCESAVGEDDIQDADINPVSKQDFMWGKFRLRGTDLILMAGTTRPDAFYGQTNLWVDPTATYKIVKVGKEKWVVGADAVKKIEHQHGKPEVLGEIGADELIGKWVRGPLIGNDIYILPADFIYANVGSGIVFSALEDPVDLLELKKIQTDQKTIRKYKLDEKVVAKLKPIFIIKVPGMGENLGEDIAKEFGIKSFKDMEKLEKAKAELNKRVFRKGVMRENCGKCAGKTVQEALAYLKEHLIKDGDTVMFYETSREAFCRDGTRIVVAVLEDQWFLDFNANGWKKKAGECLAGMSFIPETARKMFEDAFDWLDKRPTARKRGIGTPLPFDKNWIIESLSDSTIYMSFYTIKSIINKHKIRPEQLSTDFFDYVYLGRGTVGNVAASTGIKPDALKELKESLDYWYPNDHRHTYQAHLSNHLSFFIFAHSALFPKKHWPRKISLHGFVLSNGIKMSKSKGNVITLLDIKKKYGADTFRAYISTTTGLDGAFDWRTSEVNNMGKNLATIFSQIEDMMKAKGNSKLSFGGKAFMAKFEKAVLDADKALGEMKLKDYGAIMLYAIPNYIKKLKRRVPEGELKTIYSRITERWVRMLMPLIPHIAEELWKRMGKKGFVSEAKWPDADKKAIDNNIISTEKLVDQTIDDIRQ
ncbi:MAG: leucine--tRNA ligase, partial [Candidatus Aenigmarchaeota archaeon]